MTTQLPVPLDALLSAPLSEASGRALILWVRSLYGRIERGEMMIGLLDSREAARAPVALARAVECGLPEAWLDLASWLSDPPLGAPDYVGAEVALQSAQQAGVKGAQLQLVELRWFYRRDETTEQERADTLRLLAGLVGATPEDPRALHLLGLLTCQGFGTTANPTAAFRLQHRAATLGSSDALFELFIHYATGLGVSQDDSAAFRALEQAAASGHPRALYNMGAFHATGKHVAKDLARAAEWYERAFDAGNVHAAATLAVMYATGEGVEKDLEYAEQLFGQAEWLGLDVSEARRAAGL